ncbi:MAG: thioredoxin family protein [Gemmatimonadaceae bacterium]
MKVEILGTGCARCQQLTANAKAAIDQLGVNAELVKVEDVPSIMAYGVLRTPALVVNGQVRASGRVATADEIAQLITQA